MHVEVPRARRAFVTASSLGMVFLAASARADIKIVSEVTVTRQPDIGVGPAPAETVMTFYKGRYARVEVAGGPITLYNGDAGRVYTLDPARKTYYVLP